MTLFFDLFCLLEANVQNTEAYSEPCQTSKMELFVKMIYCKLIQKTEERKWMTYIIFINYNVCQERRHVFLSKEEVIPYHMSHFNASTISNIFS